MNNAPYMYVIYILLLFRSGMKPDQPAQGGDAQSMSMTVRQAVREEIGCLIREGVLPTKQTQVTSTLTPGGLVLATRQNQDATTLMRNTQFPIATVVLPRQSLNPKEQMIMQTVSAKVS